MTGRLIVIVQRVVQTNKKNCNNRSTNARVCVMCQERIWGLVCSCSWVRLAHSVRVGSQLKNKRALGAGPAPQSVCGSPPTRLSLAPPLSFFFISPSTRWMEREDPASLSLSSSSSFFKSGNKYTFKSISFKKVKKKDFLFCFMLS